MTTTTVIDAVTGIRVDTLDRGDGTGTRTTYDHTGTITDVEELTGLPPRDPEPVDPIRALGEGFLTRFPELLDALDQIAPSNSARPAVHVVADAVADGIAALEPPPPPEEEP